MYLDYYGLEKKPFHITPDPDFLYLSPSHKEGLASIIYGVEQRKGFIVISGEVGLGKTTVLRSYLKQFTSDNLKTVFIFNTKVSFKELILSIYEELELKVDADDPFQLVQNFHHFLIRNYQEGSHVVLIIDEAQNIPLETLEDLRMLSNLETSKDKLLQIILIGQPELDNLLEQNELRQLKQRVAVRAMLLPLNRKESRDYIFYRIGKAGGDAGRIFTKGALRRVIKYAEGIPRKINIVCDNALVTGLGYEKKKVTAKIVNEVIGDLEGRSRQGNLFKKPALVACAVIFLLAGSLIISFKNNMFPFDNNWIKSLVNRLDFSSDKLSASPAPETTNHRKPDPAPVEKPEVSTQNASPTNSNELTAKNANAEISPKISTTDISGADLQNSSAKTSLVDKLETPDTQNATEKNEHAATSAADEKMKAGDIEKSAISQHQQSHREKTAPLKMDAAGLKTSSTPKVSYQKDTTAEHKAITPERKASDVEILSMEKETIVEGGKIIPQKTLKPKLPSDKKIEPTDKTMIGAKMKAGLEEISLDRKNTVEEKSILQKPSKPKLSSERKTAPGDKPKTISSKKADSGNIKKETALTPVKTNEKSRNPSKPRDYSGAKTISMEEIKILPGKTGALKDSDKRKFSVEEKKAEKEAPSLEVKSDHLDPAIEKKESYAENKRLEKQDTASGADFNKIKSIFPAPPAPKPEEPDPNDLIDWLIKKKATKKEPL